MWRCSPFGSHVLEVLLVQLTKSQQTSEQDATSLEGVRILITTLYY